MTPSDEKQSNILYVSISPSQPTEVKNIWNDGLQAGPGTLLWSHPHKGRRFGTFGRGSGYSDDLDDTHAGVHEVVLVEVRVVEGLGEGEVVRGVEGVARVQVEDDLSTNAGHQVGEF